MNDRPEPVTPELLAAYRRTEYRVAAGGRRHTLSVGATHPEFDRWLTAAGHRSWCVLTPENPFSRQGGTADWPAFERLLAATARPWTDGVNVDPTARWPDERTACVLDLSTAAALDLCRRLRQNAVLVGSVDQRATLLWH